MQCFVRAKLHGIRVTGADLNYHGSVTIDADLCREAKIDPLEFVEIWNKMSGSRISTYVIFGAAGSRCCILNGAAARTCQVGDEIIIAAAHYGSIEDLVANKPRVLIFNEDNHIIDRKYYSIIKDGSAQIGMEVVDAVIDEFTDCKHKN